MIAPRGDLCIDASQRGAAERSRMHVRREVLHVQTRVQSHPAFVNEDLGMLFSCRKNHAYVYMLCSL